MVHPIIDEYYNYNPYHSRSSKFVQDKGLITNEKGTLSRSPAGTPGLPLNEHKRLGPSNLHDSIASTLTPSMHSVSPLLSPTQEPDLRHLAAVQNLSFRDPKPQELGNTKKKRKSLIGPENLPIQHNSTSPPEDPEIRAAAYGDPLKIAQYFPELNN
jgi:glutamine amidotransferase